MSKRLCIFKILNLYNTLKNKIEEVNLTNTVNSEMFTRTLFSLLFANWLPRDSKFSLIKSYYKLYRLYEYSLANSRTP